ncbi:MAG: hypothetical protein GXP62_13935 [Oligoflexia bacterium]|nr:hypothetical protein [Oligoflexia bacterium]
MSPLFTTLALAMLACTIGCRQKQQQTWAQYVDDVETTLQETGHCPLGPPKLVPQYGDNPRVPGPRGLSSSAEFSFGGLEWVPDTTRVYLDMGPAWQESGYDNYEDCIPDGGTTDTIEGVTSFGIAFSAFLPDGSHAAPMVLDTVSLTDDPVNSGGSDGFLVFPRGTETTVASPTDFASRMVLCLEEAVGPRGFDGKSPADWRGSAYFQVDSWRADGDVITESGTGSDAQPLPTDFFFKIDGIHCAWGEDASWRRDLNYIVNWGSQCDGIDNDLDGVIDEGQHFNEMDLDNNGVADCMDDWDGDGIPNTDDEDVDECCNNYATY